MSEESTTPDLIELMRGLFEAANWIDAYEEFEIEPQEILDLGNGVVFVVIRQNAHLVGSTGRSAGCM